MMTFSKRLSTPALVGLVMAACALPKAHAQSRSIHIRPSFLTPPLTLNHTTIRQTTPFRATSHSTTPFRTTSHSTTPFLSHGDLRFDRLFGAGSLGFRGFAGTGFTNPFAFPASTSFGVGGLGGGVIASSGLVAYPVPYPATFPNPYDFRNPYEELLAGASGNNSSADRQPTSLLQEKARAERIANRRKLVDEYLYERDKLPSAEDERQRSLGEQLSRSLNNPPVNEIWSGKALNDVLADLRQVLPHSDPASLRSFLVPLDDDGLKHINVTRGAGNIALLKNQGRLTWPVALRTEPFQAEREKLTARALEAVRQAKAYGQVDAPTLLQMTAGLESLDHQLQGKVRDVSPALYIEAKTFVNHFGAAITALRQEDVRSHFNGKYTLQTRNVPDLVTYLTKQGLLFAPALPDDKAAYTVLHDALATYDLALRAQATAR